jgi:hypothetical protein
MLIENARLSKLKTTFFKGGCCFLRGCFVAHRVDAFSCRSSDQIARLLKSENAFRIVINEFAAVQYFFLI